MSIYPKDVAPFFFLICGPIVAHSLVTLPPRTSPPPKALVVRANSTNSSEFGSLIDAVAALPADESSQTIFILPGIYQGQVNIQRTGPVTVQGYTMNPSSVSENTVTLVDSIPASAVGGSNDLSGTLRIHTDNVSLYNLDIRNDFGVGSQAIALSNYGDQVGVYACGLFGYQDTLLSNQGRQVYLGGWIEGAVDFIFGRLGQAYFESNTIAVKGPGSITASGREADNAQIYIFNENQVVLAPDANMTKPVVAFLGRPWGDFARVIFKSTYVTATLNPGIWSIWDPGDNRTDNVFMADWNTTGPGVPANATRLDWVTTLNATEAAAFNISTAVGDDFADWVDMDFLL